MARSRSESEWRAGSAGGRLTTTMTAGHPYRPLLGRHELPLGDGGERPRPRPERPRDGGEGTSEIELRLGLVELRRTVWAGSALDGRQARAGPRVLRFTIDVVQLLVVEPGTSRLPPDGSHPLKVVHGSTSSSPTFAQMDSAVRPSRRAAASAADFRTTRFAVTRVSAAQPEPYSVESASRRMRPISASSTPLPAPPPPPARPSWSRPRWRPARPRSLPARAGIRHRCRRGRFERRPPPPTSAACASPSRYRSPSLPCRPDGLPLLKRCRSAVRR